MRKKEKTRNPKIPGLAAGEGFEPSQTESESVVLPLHNPAKFKLSLTNKRYYSKLFGNVKGILKIFSWNFLGFCLRAVPLPKKEQRFRRQQQECGKIGQCHQRVAQVDQRPEQIGFYHRAKQGAGPKHDAVEPVKAAAAHAPA